MSSVFVVTNALRLRLFQPKTKEFCPESCEIQTYNTPIIHDGGETNSEEETNMETVILVNGMMCPHCKAAVEKACKAVPGTTDAVVDLQEKNVTVTGTADVAALKQAIVDAGYEVVG